MSSILILIAVLLVLSGCVRSVGCQPDGIHFATHWIYLDANRKLEALIRNHLENDPVTRDPGFSVKAEYGTAYLAGATSKPDVLASTVKVALETEGVEIVRCDVIVVK